MLIVRLTLKRVNLSDGMEWWLEVGCQHPASSLPSFEVRLEGVSEAELIAVEEPALEEVQSVTVFPWEVRPSSETGVEGFPQLIRRLGASCLEQKLIHAYDTWFKVLEALAEREQLALRYELTALTVYISPSDPSLRSDVHQIIVRPEDLELLEELTDSENGPDDAAEGPPRLPHPLAQKLATLDAADIKILEIMALFPPAGIPVPTLAMALEESAWALLHRLVRLRKHSLVKRAKEDEHWSLNPQIRDEARARQSPQQQRSGRGRVAAALEALALKSLRLSDTKYQVARARWNEVSDIFERLEPTEWQAGEPGAASLGYVLHICDKLNGYFWPAELRQARLNHAVVLTESTPWRHAEALLARAELKGSLLDLPGAEVDLSAALTFYERVEDSRRRANVLKIRSSVRRLRKELVGAEQDLDAARVVYRQLCDRQEQGKVLLALGELKRMRGAYLEARSDFDVAVVLFSMTRDLHSGADALFAIGNLQAAQEQCASALGWFKAALSLYEPLGAQQGVSNVLAGISQAHCELRQPGQALETARRALALGQQVNNEVAVEVAQSVLTHLASQHLSSVKSRTPLQKVWDRRNKSFRS